MLHFGRGTFTMFCAVADRSHWRGTKYKAGEQMGEQVVILECFVHYKSISYV